MSDVKEYAKELIKLAEYAEDFKKKVNSVCGGSFKWGVEEVIKSYISLFDRFCPFKVGDRVELIKSVKIDTSNHGWNHCKHFLIKGAKATIKECGYNDDIFSFHIMFDNESWIDADGNENLIKEDNKHTFHFGEHSLKRLI